MLMMTNFKGTGDKLTSEGLQRATLLCGCTERDLAAVIHVEASGSGFDLQLRPKMLFEPHIFYTLLKTRKPALLPEAVSQGVAYPSYGDKPYPKDSYSVLFKALKIDQDLALQSASWGLGQELGENYRQCGFVDAQAMVEAFMTGEDAQLLGMARFLSSTGLNEKLSKHDWAGFARGYNGPSYKSTRYDVRLAEAYEKGSAVHLTLDPSKDWGIDTRNTAIASMHLKKAMTRQTSAGVAATTAVAGGAGLYHYHALVWADWLFGALIAGGLLAAFIAAVMSKVRTNMSKTAMLGAK